MTRILAIDNASESCSVALYDSTSIHQRCSSAHRGHGDALLNMIKQILDETGYAKSAMDVLAFSRGPGSFTSLRIAAGLTQGLAIGINRPVIAISSLAALAHGVYRSQGLERTLAAIDARMGQVYYAAYETPALGVSNPLTEEKVCDPEQISWSTGNWATVGKGWQVYANAIREDKALRYVGPGAEDSAVDVAYLALNEFNKGKALSAEQALPVYIRDRVVHKAS